MERIVSRRVSKGARTWRTLPAALGMVVLAACAQVPPQRDPPVTQQRPLSALMKAAAFPNSDLVLVLLTMQQLTAAHREWEGYAYFGRLAEEQPQRRVLGAAGVGEGEHVARGLGPGLEGRAGEEAALRAREPGDAAGLNARPRRTCFGGVARPRAWLGARFRGAFR